MKIAVTSILPNIDASVGTKSHCSKYLLIVDLDTMEYEALPNPLIALGGPAAGKFLAQQLRQQNVSKLLVNNCSTNIAKSLGSAGIQIIGGASGSVRRVIRQFKKMCMAETIVIPAEDIQE